MTSKTKFEASIGDRKISGYAESEKDAENLIRSFVSSDKPKILVNFILDETGSMSGMRNEAINGFNKYVEDLKADDAADYLMTFVKFDSHRTEFVSRSLPIADIKPLTEETYRPGAMTNLYDVIGDVVSESKNTEKVITVILTDGKENCSQRWTKEKTNELIRGCEKAGQAFVYLGVSADAWANEHLLHGTMSVNNILRSSGNRGLGASYGGAFASTVMYAAGASADSLVSEETRQMVADASDRPVD